MASLQASDDCVDGFGKLLFEAALASVSHGAQDNNRQSEACRDGGESAQKSAGSRQKSHGPRRGCTGQRAQNDAG